MAAPRRVIELAIGADGLSRLEVIARSRTEPASRVERARILLAYRSEPSSTAVGARIRCDPSHRATLPSPGGRAWGDGSAGRQSATWQGSANHRGSEGLAGVFGLSESQGLRLPA